MALILDLQSGGGDFHLGWHLLAVCTPTCSSDDTCFALHVQAMQYDTECSHARVLRAIHEQFVIFGLSLCADGEDGRAPHPSEKSNQPQQSGAGGNSRSISLTQSSTGAFIPLRYSDGERDIMVQALAMFDDLIVSAIASSSKDLEMDSLPGTRADVVRRVTFRVSDWVEPGKSEPQQEETFPRDKPTAMQETRCVGTRAHEDNRIEEQDRRVCRRTLCPERDCDPGPAGAGYAAEPTDAGILLGRRDDFRSTVLSGLLLHIFPPSGQFADLFGLEESLRERILSMLGVKDLVAFGLASQVAGESAVTDSLWAPLVEAEFSEQEQRAMLFARPTAEKKACEAGGDGESAILGHGLVWSGNSDASAAETKRTVGKQGASRSLYAKLHSARLRRAAIAAEQRRRMTIFEMGALGRLGRTWGLYPWAPYLSRGPYHYAGSALSEHNWPGPAGGGAGGFNTDEAHSVGAEGLPHPMWGVGWGRRSGSWRTFGAVSGAGGTASCGVFGDSGGGAGGTGIVPPPSYGLGGRRGRGRFLGQVTGW